ncbi:hypothetical protein JZ751_020707 [Albula glossodonta]|uniref:Programmed cell death 7 n=1 Tax=Albula glossodonta TaxID=121402 RepID=A0A8T2PIG0_9TELE|nr:hypothetical protein JZ751_020707 [Albula glossodonta]
MEKPQFQSCSVAPQQASSNTGCSDPNFYDMRNGAFARPPMHQPTYDSSGSFRSNVTPAISSGAWHGQGIYQPPQQTVGNNQRLNYGQSEWSPVPQTMGRGRDAYRPPFPQQHSFNIGYQSHTIPNFDPTRPPPSLYASQPGQFLQRFDDRKDRAADASPRPSLDYMQQEQSADRWQQGSDERQQNRSRGPQINRSFDEYQGYTNSRPPPNEIGFQSFPSERVQRSSTVSQTHNERWQQQGPPCSEGSGHAKDFQHSLSDAGTKQRQLDEQWLVKFLLNRKTSKSAISKRPSDNLYVSKVRETLYGAVRLVADLSISCQKLKENVENENVWAELYPKAVLMKRDLVEELKPFNDPAYIDSVKKKLSFISKKRLRNRRKKREQFEEKQEEDTRAVEREAVIDKWRMKRIQEVEEKKRELELKMAADSVLSEVRKKQADAKRMLDVLRSLEKLRKLRKEAAGRRGVIPEKEADEVFDGHVERLRKLIRKRTAVYAAEEKALRVMLEGEQEEERKREQEKRQKKEREKFLQKKQEVETMLFGEEMPPDHPLQPFKQCYTQAEHSLPALIQIRREWDSYLVPADHPDGSFIPQSWVLPELPSDETWASALEK